MKINFILTTFSPSMFGEGATCHIRAIAHDEASSLINDTTRIVATRTSHERLAKKQFPGASDEVARYATLSPSTNAIHIHYRGPPVPDSGELPLTGVVTFYLIEATEYQA